MRLMKLAVFEGVFCASSTMRMILANKVSLDSFETVMVRASLKLIVLPKISSPTVFSTGTDSPEMAASSIRPRPDAIEPSMGMLAPLGTINVSPTFRSLTATSSIEPSGLMRFAISGTMFINAVIAWVLLSVAYSSSEPDNEKIKMSNAPSIQ